MDADTLDGQGIVIRADQLDVKVHNGFITMSNPATGQWRTLKVHTYKKKGDKFSGTRVVSLLTGPDNGTNYEEIGFIRRLPSSKYPSGGEHVVVIHPDKRGKDKRSAYEVMGDMLVNPVKWASSKGVEYRISGICRRCNRRLTVPGSIDSGMGPECRAKAS